MDYLIVGFVVFAYVGVTISCSYQMKANFTYEMVEALGSNRFNSDVERVFIYLFDNSLDPLLWFKFIGGAAVRAIFEPRNREIQHEPTEFDHGDKDELVKFMARLLLINIIRSPLSYTVLFLLLIPYVIMKKISGRKHIKESLIFKVGRFCYK